MVYKRVKNTKLFFSPFLNYITPKVLENCIVIIKKERCHEALSPGGTSPFIYT